MANNFEKEELSDISVSRPYKTDEFLEHNPVVAAEGGWWEGGGREKGGCKILNEEEVTIIEDGDEEMEDLIREYQRSARPNKETTQLL